MLADTPAQRQRWRVGLALASRALLTVLVARLGLFAAMLLLPSAWTPSVYFAIGWVASLAWIIGVWLITPPALDYGLQWRCRLRIAVRYSQLLWIVGYALWTLAHELSGTALEPTLWRLALVCRGVAGVGGLALAALLLRVAEEAGLENGARRLNAAVWLLPLPTLILALVPAQVAWFTLILIFGVLLLWWWLLWLYARGLLEMQRHVSWSMRETIQRQTREQRVAETRDQLEQQVRSTIRPVPATGPEIPLEPADGEAGPGPLRGSF
ncbi:MAG: hypothetical protein IH804_09695 [Planctomycetes bacterium]|nr:hypothetical protein [Planctomycetota bacterium]